MVTIRKIDVPRSVFERLAADAIARAKTLEARLVFLATKIDMAEEGDLWELKIAAKDVLRKDCGRET
jgi:hypothetical protein